jgi:hypothetical protein
MPYTISLINTCEGEQYSPNFSRPRIPPSSIATPTMTAISGGRPRPGRCGRTAPAGR